MDDKYQNKVQEEDAVRCDDYENMPVTGFSLVLIFILKSKIG